MELISNLQASTLRAYGNNSFDTNLRREYGLICVLKTCQNGQGLER